MLRSASVGNDQRMHRVIGPALVGAIAAVAVFGPFFAVVDASDTQTIVHSAPGAILEGKIDNAAFADTVEVSCGEQSFAEVRSAVTDGGGMTGVVVADGVECLAQASQIRAVRSGRELVCADAKGTLHDATGNVAGSWRVCPDHTGTNVLTTTLH
jgi:hypothetical protein